MPLYMRQYITLLYVQYNEYMYRVPCTVLYTIHGGKFAQDAMETWMVGHCHVETCR